MENQVIKSEELQLMEAKMEQEFALSPIGRMVRSMEAIDKVAEFYSKSDLVPATFKGKKENCAIAVDMSLRMGMNPVMVMQNMYVVHGQPSLSSQMIIALVNKSGEFEPLKWEYFGKPGDETFGCRCYTYRLNDPEHNHLLNSSVVSIKMAKDEKWGAKWYTMPEQMMRYRTAVFWARTHAPEITMGFMSQEEVTEPSFKFDHAEEVTGQKSLADLALDAALNATPKKTEEVVVETPQEAENAYEEELLLTPETESPIEKTLE